MADIRTDLPVGYITPPFPSLAFPLNESLYYRYDIWYFTVVWSLLFTVPVYLAASLWAYWVFKRKAKLYGIVIPIIATLYGSLVAFIRGSVTGLVLSLVYQAGSFEMSTWIPMLWALLISLMQILGSLSNDTTML